MINNKQITMIVIAIMAVAVGLCLVAIFFADELISTAGGAGVNMEYETELFDTSKIISVNIIMDEAEWDDMLANATDEVYYRCDVEINGEMFSSVGIRPKGNTSLTYIADDPDTDRFSLKLEFDQYVAGQTCFGLDKLLLNNNYADATNMKEALIYDMYQYLGTDASLYNYAQICVNGDYWGVYLALEAVEDSFLLRNYGVESGQLYKPDSMDMGARGGGEDFAREDMGEFDPSEFGGEKPQAFDPAEFGDQPPQDFDPAAGERAEMVGGGGGFSMGGNGADLNYSDDEPDSYSTIWDSAVTDASTGDHQRVIKALKNIAAGTDLEAYMDIDNLLRYMAVHVFSVNDDSLSGSMAHNYYLYEYDGQLNLLPWDYNLALGGMGRGGDASDTINDAIDAAFAGTDFFDTLMANEAYQQQYYAYLQQLVDEYINGGGFAAFYARTRSQIDSLVESDPTAFYSYDEYLAAVDMLCRVVQLRGAAISGQLDGSIPATESEQLNSEALIDASAIDLSIMGSMGMGDGMRDFMPGDGTTAPSNGNQSTAPPAADAETPPSPGSQAHGAPPNAFAMSNTAEMDAGVDSSTNRQNLATYGVCFAVLMLAVLFGVAYKRRPRKR